MTIIKCPKCDKEIEINIKNSIDESREVYICPYCKYLFMFADK